MHPANLVEEVSKLLDHDNSELIATFTRLHREDPLDVMCRQRKRPPRCWNASGLCLCVQA